MIILIAIVYASIIISMIGGMLYFIEKVNEFSNKLVNYLKGENKWMKILY